MTVRYVGVDLGLISRHKAAVLDERGKILEKRFSFGVSKKEFERFEAICLKDAVRGTQLKVIMESTSISWLPLSLYLTRKGHIVYRVKSEKVSDLRKYLKKHAKTNTIDSLTLAKMPLIDEESLYPVYIPQTIALSLDRRVKQRDKITKSLSSRKNRIRSAYAFAIPGLTEVFANEAFSGKASAFYERYSNPFKIRRLGVNRLSEFLKNVPNTRSADQQLAHKIFNVCLEAISLYENKKDDSCAVDYEEFQDEIRAELELFKAEQRQIELLDQRIKALYQKVLPSDNLRTIPGVGTILAPLFAASIGDPRRFPDVKGFQCYTGMVPKKQQFSQSDKKGLRMTKAGKNILKKGLFIAADSARRIDIGLAKVYYQQMVEKGNHHFKALCAVAAHLASRILKVYAEDRPYLLYDEQGRIISREESTRIVAQSYSVPEEVRKRTRTTKIKRKRIGHFKRRAETNLTLKRPLYPLPGDNILQTELLSQESYAGVETEGD